MFRVRTSVAVVWLACHGRPVGAGSAALLRRQATTTSQAVTAVSECHLHEASVFCMAQDTEYFVDTTATATKDVPPRFTGCHQHDSETFCISPNGDDVELILAADVGDHDHGDEEHDEEHNDEEHHDGDDQTSQGTNCHFHAGVEHCESDEQSEGATDEASCDPIDRTYNVSLRVGLLFVILATSSIGVFSPILLSVFLPQKLGIIMTMVKQFGTGVIISTAFVHLFTHASIMFNNRCIGNISYESTAAAILMSGLFISFLVEFLGHRLVRLHQSRKVAPERLSTAAYQASMINIMVLEGGIIFHSLLIGVTLVVAGDSFFITLFIVILFHQMFEGLALGSRISSLGSSSSMDAYKNRHMDQHMHRHDDETNSGADSHSKAVPDAVENAPGFHISMVKKLLLAAGFAVVTPIGMAIGIGVLNQFNGNDPATIWAIGTLDAFSAGILVWVGVVEMWAEDWMLGGEMANASLVKTLLGLVSLAGGMVLMSLLGKWA